MITASGFQRPTRAELLALVKQKFIDQFSTVVGGVTYVPSLEPEDEKGAEAEILTDIYDDFYQLAEALYYAKFISTATGVQLDRAAAPTLRRAASQADVVLSFTGDVDTVVPAGSVFETEDKREYATTVPVTLDEYGLGEVPALAVVAGVAGNAPSAAITFVPVPIVGLNTVTNDSAALNGLDIETDADFRARLLTDRGADRTSSLQAIVDAVSDVANVTAVRGFENTENSTDVDGLPPGAVEIVTRGGDDTEIAEAIFRVKAAGIGTHGNVDTLVTDAAGDTKHILHSHVDEIDVYFLVTLTITGDYNPVTAEPELKQRILDYVGGVNLGSVVSQGLDVGEDVAAWEAQANIFQVGQSKIPGIAGVPPVTKIGVLTGDRTHDTVVIASREKAITDFTKIAFAYLS